MRASKGYGLAALLGLALIASGCAARKTPAQQQAQRCFDAGAVTAFEVVDGETVNLRVGASERYQIKLLGVCPDIDWAGQIALESRGSSQVCTGLDLTIHFPSARGPQECAAESIAAIAP